MRSYSKWSLFAHVQLTPTLLFTGSANGQSYEVTTKVPLSRWRAMASLTASDLCPELLYVLRLFEDVLLWPLR